MHANIFAVHWLANPIHPWMNHDQGANILKPAYIASAIYIYLWRDASEIFWIRNILD